MGSQLYFHGDYQNSTIKVTAGQMDGNELTSYRYAYTPTGEAYGFKHRYSHEQLTRSYVAHGPNRNHVQNLYTGKYAEALTGISHMDARWYDAQKARFIQPDQYNHANLMLPKGAQSELLRYIGRTQSDLLKDPAQQIRYGYVSGNFLTWNDPLGLEKTCKPSVERLQKIDVLKDAKIYEAYGYIIVKRDHKVIIDPNEVTFKEDSMGKLVNATSNAAEKLKTDIVIVSSYRSQKEQDDLVDRGLSDAKESKHTYEDAVDLFVAQFKDGNTKAQQSKKTAVAIHSTKEFSRVSSYSDRNTAHADFGTSGSGPGLYDDWNFIEE